MSKSPYKDRAPGRLKDAVCDLVTACGGAPRAADVARVGRAQLFRYGDDSEENAGRHMPVDVVRALEGLCGDPVVTRFLAAEAGAVLLQVPPAAPPGGDWSVRLSALAKETSDVFGRFAAALADGRISPREAGETIEEIDQAMTRLAELRCALRRVAQVEAGGR
ncbi:MAG: hypothetical protein Kow00114_27320 [Kiloniellaceae bacterium]